MTALNLKSPQRLLLAALGVGVSVDALFYGKLPGISMLLFTLLALGVLFWLGWAEGVQPRLANLWLLAPLLFLAAMVGVRANGFLTFLNVMAVLSLLALFGHFYSGGRLEHLGLAGYPAAFSVAVGSALIRVIPFLPTAMAMLNMRGTKNPKVLAVVRGLVLALPVLVVFAALLSSADMVFARYLGGLMRVDILLSLPEFAWRMLLVLGAAWIVAGTLIGALHGRNLGRDEHIEHLLDDIPNEIKIGVVETSTVLVLVDLLFVGFGLIQFAYLFGGAANISEGGFTYAEYARRGFFELLAVALLSLGLILLLNALTWRETRVQRLVFSTLSSFMVVMVLVLLASALRRMVIYEEAYGYTNLRLYVHIFMIWLAVALVWYALAVWVRPRRFAIGGFVAALGFLITLNIVNPDATIAEQNIGRYAEGGQLLDTYYLANLSDDAVPVLVRHVSSLSGYELVAVVKELELRQAEFDADKGWREWPAFNLARWEAYNALKAPALAQQRGTETRRQ